MLKFSGLPTNEANRLRAGGVDHHNQPPESQTSDGNGNPCRHCLGFIDKGENFLVLSHRPFQSIQPYAEQGPIFLHAENCPAHQSVAEKLPPVLHDSRSYLLRGYDQDERIVYGSGGMVEHENIITHAKELFQNPRIRFIHVRSSSNNCWQARIDPA
ncbi:MAG: DUF1203 domain-containing protein [Rhizobiaceae bacterium]